MQRYVIGVAGGTGAGKTTLAQELAGCIGAATVLHEDRYYRDNSHLPLPSRETLNYDHPEALDLALMALHVRELVCGRSVSQPCYNFVLHVRTGETVRIAPARFIIVEGLFTLYHEQIREVTDCRVFLDLEEDIRLSRRIARDISERGRTLDSVMMQWDTTVRPMHRQFIQPSRSRADLVLSGGDRVESNTGRIRDFLASRNIL